MTHEIKLSQPKPDSLPCLLCPFCSSENVEIASRPKRQTLANGAVETTIVFGCQEGHSWAWVLYDWEGRIFFSVEERKKRPRKGEQETDEPSDDSAS